MYVQYGFLYLILTRHKFTVQKDGIMITCMIPMYFFNVKANNMRILYHEAVDVQHFTYKLCRT
jgi:hypothetical protein